MLSAFTNCLKIIKLRQRIFLTLVLIFVARVGANIPLPGIDPLPMQDFFSAQSISTGGNLIGLYNMFTGGALLNGAIFGLGIMPYISASIIFQLLTPIIPGLTRLQQEGESGRKKLAQYTRYTTVVVCFLQAILVIKGIINNPSFFIQGYDVNTYGSIVIINTNSFLFTSTIFLTTGTLLLMWIGEQISQRGIGNGISILITVGILADLPRAILQAYTLFSKPIGVIQNSIGLLQAVLMLTIFIIVVGSVVAVTQAIRKIPVQYAKRIVGRRIYGSQSSFLPLKINYSGVMPIIFANAMILFPQQIFAWLAAAYNLPFFNEISHYLTHGAKTYYLIYAILVLSFSYFWVSVMFKPIQIADDLKKNSGYIPGVRPGEPTAKFLDFVMTRLTLSGSIFLLIIAVLPDLMHFICNIPYTIALFFGGTGTLISVGVILDTMRQIETHLLQRHYDGFLRKGKIRQRSESRKIKNIINLKEIKNLKIFCISLGFLFFIGIISWILKKI